MLSQWRKLLFSGTIILTSTLIINGCTAAKKPMRQEQPAEKPPHSITAPNYSPTTRNQSYPYDVAERAVKQANQVAGVQTSAAVISGNNIYLGLTLKPDIDKNKSSQVEKEVMAQVTEPHYTVMITSDTTTVTLIQRVASDIAQGKPLASFKSEIEYIGTRIRPGIKKDNSDYQKNNT